MTELLVHQISVYLKILAEFSFGRTLDELRRCEPGILCPNKKNNIKNPLMEFFQFGCKTPNDLNNNRMAYLAYMLLSFEDILCD